MRETPKIRVDNYVNGLSVQLSLTLGKCHKGVLFLCLQKTARVKICKCFMSSDKSILALLPCNINIWKLWERKWQLKEAGKIMWWASTHLLAPCLAPLSLLFSFSFSSLPYDGFKKYSSGLIYKGIKTLCHGQNLPSWAKRRLTWAMT